MYVHGVLETGLVKVSNQSDQLTMLCIDLGTTAGYAMRHKSGAYVSGVWSFTMSRFEGGGMRYLKFRRQLDALHDKTPIGICFYEEVRAHKGVDAAHVYGGLLATLTSWCELNEIPYSGIGVGKIKKYATGKGNAGKPDMIHAVSVWGYEPKDDNEADAIALLHMMVEAGQ